MCRFLLGALAIVAACGTVAAQPPSQMALSTATFGPYAGGFHPLLYTAPILTPGSMAPAFSAARPGYFLAYSPFSPFSGPGYYSNYAYGHYGFNGYGYSPYYGYFPLGFYSPRYIQPPIVYSPPKPVVPPYSVELSGEFTGSLTLDFPAPARVWLDGKEVAGPPAATRKLTSPVLRSTQKHTFHIRAQWKWKGKTYQADRKVPIGPGDRSKMIIVSGEEVAAK